MIDEAIKELEKVRKEKEVNSFFLQFEYSLLDRESIYLFNKLPKDIQEWIKSIYSYSMYNDKFFLSQEEKAKEVTLLIDIVTEFECRVDNIISSFSSIFYLYHMYDSMLDKLPIKEKILATFNNKTKDRLYYITNLFKKKYKRCFDLWDLEQTRRELRNEYIYFIDKYKENIADIHKKLFPKQPEIEFQPHYTDDGILVLEKPRIINIKDIEPEENTKLNYLIKNIEHLPNDILENDDWWNNLFNELAI